MLTIGSLFSGVGGLELGLEWAGLGPTLWQVERDPFCRKILARHWPDVERYDDVRRVTGIHVEECDLDADCWCERPPDRLWPVDVLCGGFPCQDVSSAGKRKGLAGSRSGLWYQFDRIVGELLPPVVVVENVTSGAARWVDAVRGCLEGRGYETLPIPLSARAIGAPHRRERIFIVARLANSGDDRRQGGAAGYGTRRPLDEQQGGDTLGRHPGQRMDRRGDPQPLLGGGPDGRPAGVDTAPFASMRPVRWPAPRGAYQHDWEPRRAVPATALECRAERLHALGNAVVPQCAEVVGWVIRELLAS